MPVSLWHMYQWRIQDFPEGGAPTSEGGGRQPIIWPIFPKNCMKMKKFWPRGGRPLRPTLDPPLCILNFLHVEKDAHF